jgi:hypothetical protein
MVFRVEANHFRAVETEFGVTGGALPADHGKQPAGFAVEFFLDAVREKQIRPFERAERRDENVFRRHARRG